MRALPETALRRPVATAMFCVAVVLLGAISFTRLPLDLLPDVSFPTLSVSTAYPGAGPSEVERFVTARVEEELSRIAGVRQVASRSREGVSLVDLRFHWGTDMDFAALHARERLDNLSEELPDGAERPTILSTDPTDEPVLSVAVTGRDLLSLRELSEAVFKRRLEQQDGVALAAVSGGPEPEIRVVVDPAGLRAHGLRVEEITRALDRANYSAPGGMIRRGRFQYSLRTLGQFEDVADLRRVPVPRRGGGGRSGRGGSPGVVRLGDVADVREAFADRRTLARHDGEPAVGIQVYKESGANTVRVSERVDAVLRDLRSAYPEVTLAIASDQAQFVEDAISNVVQALLIGGLLAFGVLFLFLREPRYPVAVGLAIPLSVAAAFGLCHLADVSLNVMSLGGLALGVGMLVDNSIVVLENVFRHRDEEGRPPVEAAARGAGEVAGAITASTLTTVAVFGPVLYVEGVAGALFGDLSLAVAFSLLASLGVALTLLPVLSARVGGGGPGEGGEGIGEGGDVGPGSGGRAGDRGGGPDARPGRIGRSPVGGRMARVRALGRRALHVPRQALRYVLDSVRETFRELGRWGRRAAVRTTAPVTALFDRGFRRFEAAYERALRWSLDHRPRVLGMAAAGLAAALLLGAGLPRGLMPEVDEGRFRVELELPVGTPLEATARAAERLEAMLRETEGVAGVFTRVGRSERPGAAGAGFAGPNQAVLEVRASAGGPSTPRVIEAFRGRVQDSGVDPRFVAVESGRATSLGRALALGSSDLAVVVRGSELDSLVAVAERARERLEGVRGVADPRVDLERTQPELEIEVDRAAAARHGLTVEEVADALENYLRGARADRAFARFAEKIDIRVVLPEDARRDLGRVLGLTVGDVPVRELVRVREGYGPVEIRREDQTRTVRVLADVTGGGLAGTVERVRGGLEGVELPELTTLEVGGANQQMRESFRSLFFAFGLALFLVYLILAAQFESVVQPVVVLVSVPLAAVGAVAALWLARDGINVMSGIGFVILVGIVVNDAIIKIDFINQRRAEGLGRRAAILEAGRLRLRPIVMTTVTTVLGLTPLALGWGAGADLRAPLAVAVIGGLLSATFLTLIVVPVVYSLLVPGEPVATPAGSPA